MPGDALQYGNSISEEQSHAVIICPNCTLKTDIILKSSDGIQYAAHAENLERYSEGFPPALFADEGERPVIHLEESSEVVALMLQYMHLKPQPNVEALSFVVLDELANAVEKYLIHSAIVVCRLCMRDNVSSYPLYVLRYAFKHGYKELADKAAQYIIHKDFKEIKEFFGVDSGLTYQWMLYREPWLSALLLVYSKEPPVILGALHGCFSECELWQPFYTKILKEVDCAPGNMTRFQSIVTSRILTDLRSCDQCTLRALNWVSVVNRKIGEVPPFSACM